jgi:hypothetical protein
VSEHTAEIDAALAALGRLFDQVIHTAGDDAGRTRATEDLWTIHAALTRVIPPGSPAAPTGDPT